MTTNPADKLFSKTTHAATYSLYRPDAPTGVIDRVLKFLYEKLPASSHELAVDIGCGSGQSTSVLSPHFKHVLGVDTSAAQIDEAIKREIRKNVQYKVGTCDAIPVESGSAELITACAAIHWFDIPKFYEEVERILIPGGVVAAFCNDYPKPVNMDHAEEIGELLIQVHSGEMAEYKHPNTALFEGRYSKIPAAYSDSVRDNSVYVVEDWTLYKLLGYVKSWSFYQSMHDAKPEAAEKLVSDLQTKIMEVMRVTGSPKDVHIPVKISYVILLARKPIPNA